MKHKLTLRRRAKGSADLDQLTFTVECQNENAPEGLIQGMLADLEYQANQSTESVTTAPPLRVWVEEERYAHRE